MAARHRSVSVCKALCSPSTGSAAPTSRSFASSAANQAETRPPRQHQNGKVEDKLAARDLFISVLGATTTKRDAKSYLSQFTPDKAEQSEPPTRQKAQEIVVPFKSDHVALIKIRSLESQSDDTVAGLVRTISQLNRLGLRCIVVLDCAADDPSQDAKTTRKTCFAQADRLVAALEKVISTKACRLDDLFSYSPPADSPQSAPIQSQTPRQNGPVEVQHPVLLLRPLKRGVIPVIPSIAFTRDTQRLVDVSPDDIVLGLTRALAGVRTAPHDPACLDTLQTSRMPFVLDRLIVLDPAGAIPSAKRGDGAHVFLNMEQEFADVHAELAASQHPQHARNLVLLRNALALLPASSSALLTIPSAVATPARAASSAHNPIAVATRRPRNPLIFNLLTDKPTVSSSLPTARMSLSTNPSSGPATPPRNLVTFAKRGLPLTMIPDPRTTAWTPPALTLSSTNNNPIPDLADHPAIDLARLVALIDDSFGRPLAVPAYLRRIHGRLAGVIVAGAYDGGAILTWELPPSVAPAAAASPATARARAVPYLDKFAVRRRSQGAGGVADIVFSAMVRSCFPAGVVWRSRSDNPVNKWYFERAVGTWKLDGGWTMFWTVPGLSDDPQRFADAVEVCRSIQPTWADGKSTLD